MMINLRPVYMCICIVMTSLNQNVEAPLLNIMLDGPAANRCHERPEPVMHDWLTASASLRRSGRLAVEKARLPFMHLYREADGQPDWQTEG